MHLRNVLTALVLLLAAAGSASAQSYRLYNPSGSQVTSVSCPGPPYGPCSIPNLNTYLDDTCGGTWKTAHDYFGQRTYIVTNNDDLNSPYCTGAPGVSVCKVCFTVGGVDCVTEGQGGCSDGGSWKTDTLLQFTLSEPAVGGGMVVIGGEGRNCYLNGNLVYSAWNDNTCGAVGMVIPPSPIPGSAFIVGTNTLTCSVAGAGTDQDNGFKLSEFYYDLRQPISSTDYCETLRQRPGQIITSCPGGNYVAEAGQSQFWRCGTASWPCSTNPLSAPRFISYGGLNHEYICANDNRIYECRGTQSPISSTQTDPTGTYRTQGTTSYYCTNGGDWINCGTAAYPTPTGCTSCGAGTANCDQDAANQCEVNTNTDPLNCGSCGNACGPNTVCSAGSCACGTGFGNCDGSFANGCEVNLQNNPGNCGACGNTCASGVCKGGACGESCFNDADDDGDGKADQADEDCQSIIVGGLFEEDGKTVIPGVTVKLQGVGGGESFSYTTTSQSDGSFGQVVAGDATYEAIFTKTGYAPRTITDIATVSTKTKDLGPIELEREVGGCISNCMLTNLKVCSAGCTVHPGCAFHDSKAKSLCDGKKPGTRVIYDDASYLVCCEGSPIPKGAGASIATSQNVISQTIPATSGGQPVHVVVITVG